VITHQPSRVQWRARFGNALWNDLTFLYCWEKEQNITVTTGNNNYLPCSRFCSRGLPQILNILCNQNLKLFLQIHNAETKPDRRDYLWTLLYKICALMEFKSARIVIPFCRVWTTCGLMLSALKMQEVLTSSRLLGVYRNCQMWPAMLWLYRQTST